jgi:hypothetical protein
MTDKVQVHKLEILPLKKKKTQKKYNIPEPLLDISEGGFCLTVVAPSCSGKTFLIQNLIHNVNFGYKEAFSEIIYISPTLEHDQCLQFMKDVDDVTKISDPDELQNIDTILKEIVKTQREKGDDKEPILIVLDDCTQFLDNHGFLNQIPQLSRHYKLSFICSFQSYMSVPNKLRKNSSGYVIFRIYNKKDLDAIEDEIGSEYEDFMKYYHEATADKYNFLYMNKRDMSLYHNFKKLLWVK